MKKLTIIFICLSFVLLSACKGKKELFLPEANNDKVYTTIGFSTDEYLGDGYTIKIPAEDYSYDKDFENGNLEEKWEHIKKDDVEIKVTTYKNSDELTARGMFLRENDDYIFEDLLGYSLCGIEPDGDTLWFDLYESKGNVYIVSWEYPKNSSEGLKEELAEIAGTFKIIE